MIQRRVLAGNLGKFYAWLLINSCFRRARKSRFFTDYMYKPRTSRSSRCNSPSTAPQSAAPGTGHTLTPPHLHTQLTPLTHPLASLPSHLHTWACMAAGEQESAVLACPAPTTSCLCSHSTTVHTQGGACARSQSCASSCPLSCTFLLAQRPHHLKCLCSRVFFSMCSSSFLFSSL